MHFAETIITACLGIIMISIIYICIMSLIVRRQIKKMDEEEEVKPQMV